VVEGADPGEPGAVGRPPEAVDVLLTVPEAGLPVVAIGGLTGGTPVATAVAAVVAVAALHPDPATVAARGRPVVALDVDVVVPEAGHVDVADRRAPHGRPVARRPGRPDPHA